jgi:hypothetical protein
VACDRGQLVDRVCRILLSGARESDPLVSVLNSSTEDNSGSHHAGRLLCFLSDVFAGRVPVELRHRVRIHCVRSLFHVL